jgi:hypothetical protein
LHIIAPEFEDSKGDENIISPFEKYLSVWSAPKYPNYLGPDPKCVVLVYVSPKMYERIISDPKEKPLPFLRINQTTLETMINDGAIVIKNQEETKNQN